MNDERKQALERFADIARRGGAVFLARDVFEALTGPTIVVPEGWPCGVEVPVCKSATLPPGAMLAQKGDESQLVLRAVRP